MLKPGLLGLVLAVAVAGCWTPGFAPEPRWSKIESSIMNQARDIDSGPTERWASPALPYEELRDQMEAMIAEGWEVDAVSAADKDLPGLYIVTYRR